MSHKLFQLTLLILIVGLVLGVSGCGSSRTSVSGGPDDLQITDVKEGTGREAERGDTVTVHYTGTLLNGKKFDSSRDSGKPFSFLLGAGEVIKGWDQGVVGMKVGGTRKLVIPSHLAYGDRGTPDGAIPPGATLNFEIELLKLEGK